MPLTRVRTGGITDANVTTAKVANNAIGTSQLALANQGYEHIQTKVSSSNGSIAPANDIFFTDVFSANYVAYKVVVGHYNNTGSEGNDISFRVLDSSNSAISTNDYQYSNTRQRSTNDSYLAVSGANTSDVQIWRDLWTNEAGGFSGEMNIYNVFAPTLNSVDTDRGDYYRALATWDFAGYDTGSSAYTRQSGFARYNANKAGDFFKGFAFVAGATERLGTHISVFGLRNPV